MKNKNNNVVFVVVLVVSVVTSFIAGKYFANNSIINYSLAKEIKTNMIDDSKEIVYNKEVFIPKKIPEDLNSNEVSMELPIINLNYHSVKKINKEIENKYNELRDDNIITDDMVNVNSIKYRYYVNNNILSLILEYKNYNYTASYITYEYKTYNINKNTGEVLTNEDLIKTKNMSVNDVYNKIIKNIEKEYETIGYDDYKNTDFYKDTIINIKKDDKITVPIFLDTNNNLNVYLNMKMNMGPGTITRNFVLK